MNCTVKDCDKPLICKGMCSKHYYRIKRGGTAEISKRQQQALRKCSIEGCNDSHTANALNVANIPTKTGKGPWSGKQVQQILRRINNMSPLGGHAPVSFVYGRD